MRLSGTQWEKLILAMIPIRGASACDGGLADVCEGTVWVVKKGCES
jgi:hypothetical protein